MLPPGARSCAGLVLGGNRTARKLVPVQRALGVGSALTTITSRPLRPGSNGKSLAIKTVALVRETTPPNLAVQARTFAPDGPPANSRVALKSRRTVVSETIVGVIVSDVFRVPCSI